MVLATPMVPVVASIPAPGSYLCGLAWDGERLWHSDQEAARIWALDPESGAVLRSLTCPWVRADLTFSDGLLGQIGGRPKRIVEVDPRTGAVVRHRPVRPPSGRLTGLERGPEGVWMCLRAPAVVQLRDVATLTVQAEYPIAGSPSGLTYADGVVVYGDFEAGLLRAVDAGSGALRAAAPVGGHPTGVTWDGERLWYCDFRARRLAAVRLADVLTFGVLADEAPAAPDRGPDAGYRALRPSPRLPGLEWWQF
jgi:hypothetical protein